MTAGRRLRRARRPAESPSPKRDRPLGTPARGRVPGGSGSGPRYCEASRRSRGLTPVLGWAESARQRLGRLAQTPQARRRPAADDHPVRVLSSLKCDAKRQALEQDRQRYLCK
jgi:hypothetical protein